MRHYSLNKLMELANLSDLIFSDDGKATPERIVTDLGLYESCIIDTGNIHIYYTEGVTIESDANRFVNKVEVSDDVKALHELIVNRHNIMLPCAECRKDLPFCAKVAYNPRVLWDIQNSCEETENGDIYSCVIDPEEYLPKKNVTNVFTPVSAKYKYKNNEMSIGYGNRSVVNIENSIQSCIDGILENAGELRKEFICSLNSTHTIFIDCIIFRAFDVCKEPDELKEYKERKRVDQSAQMTDKEKEIFEKYEKLKQILVFEKVGQEPSMADLQMFDIEKYRTILSRERFGDFSMALGLYSSGVGCGSLLYLRRVFESVILMLEKECESMENWDATEYTKKRFNEKIEYIESFGKKIIPDELAEVRSHIYGKLSQGVHEMTEQEALKLFPILKFSIELILDNQIAQKERTKKIKEMARQFNS